MANARSLPEATSRRGRKAESGNVRLKPVFREEPDIEKLGRAIIAMAVRATNGNAEDKTEDQNFEEEV